MRVFYRGPRALITSDTITVARSTSISYVLADLIDLHLVVQRRGPEPLGSRAMGVSALVGGIVTVPVMGPVSPPLTVAMVGALLLCAFICLRIDPPAHHELVATYRGRRVVIFASDDPREFGQVCRGVQRAMERQR
ncbi:hypothetical protein GCM10020358_54050 [Amorphoplanes nipponensis]|uniref:Uncharacterized protein n=1 Tax=Actinoplanes nipponensis TaxID=135950 RepID=A0A919JIJ9_9ACTN|nr:DUF6232 family protein [Actinoplanes nipponensis]GIE51191.1 hypothetical protein Ani05nite_47250 [Actinoplanes nipponensis]